MYDKGKDKENVRNVSQSFRVVETFPTVKTRGVRTVYHVQQHFWIRGIEEDIVRVWKAVEPQPRFEHAFHVFSKSMRIPRGRNNVVILDDKAPLQIALLRQDVGPEAKIIIASDHPETFLAEAAPEGSAEGRNLCILHEDLHPADYRIPGHHRVLPVRREGLDQ